MLIGNPLSVEELHETLEWFLVSAKVNVRDTSHVTCLLSIDVHLCFGPTGLSMSRYQICCHCLQFHH